MWSEELQDSHQDEVYNEFPSPQVHVPALNAEFSTSVL